MAIRGSEALVPTITNDDDAGQLFTPELADLLRALCSRLRCNQIAFGVDNELTSLEPINPPVLDGLELPDCSGRQR